MINWFDFSYWGNEKQYVLNALNSTWISGGEYVERFEHQLKVDLNLDNVITVCNGTAALQLAFIGANIQPNDEVIVPAFGFMAAANILKLMNAKPVFVDVDFNTWNLNSNKIIFKITSRTKAIVVIHNYGIVTEIEKIQRIAKENNLLLIEDCAEAIFSKYNDKFCGSFGDISTFSFHATKTISTGEGGMISCKDDNLYNKLKMIRSHGLRRETVHYWHEYYGNNFRMSNVLAAIGLGQLEKKKIIIKQKQRVYERYKNNLKNIPTVIFQQHPLNSNPVYWVVAVYINSSKFSRDNIMKNLLNDGIECRPGFYTPDQLPIYQNEIKIPNLIANDLAKNIIVFPSYPSLKNDKIDFICNSFLKCFS